MDLGRVKKQVSATAGRKKDSSIGHRVIPYFLQERETKEKSDRWGPGGGMPNIAFAAVSPVGVCTFFW